MSYAFRVPNKEINRKQRALVLIQGSGAVRAGIWARSVCINEGLQTGSMLPFLEVCKNLDIAVLVMNPNFNRDPETGAIVPYSQTMTEHAKFVWRNYVVDSGFEDISVVAHSAGGACLQEIQREFASTFYNQVKKIAYTDSWVISKSELTKEQQVFMFRNAVHYEASSQPLLTKISVNMDYDTCPVVSAGHSKHEYTTGYAQQAIFDQFGFTTQH